MKVAIKTSLLAKRDMYVNSSQNQRSVIGINYQGSVNFIAMIIDHC